jgi:5-formyltetrahydrofolate cyclo-ligase
MTKAGERARIRHLRSLRTDEQRTLAAEHIAARVVALLPGSPATVTAYQSLPGEPGTSPLIAGVLGAGHRLLLPRIAGKDLTWVEVNELTTFARGPLGISEPTGPALPSVPSPLLGAAVLVMPGLSVDHTGRRLGQGGGYYDRALSTVPPLSRGGPLRITVLFDDEFVDEVPSEPHDCAIDILVTPDRTVRFGTSTANYTRPTD